MDRNELVRLLVLNEITDDYENVDQTILRNAAREAAECGFVIERSEVVDALASLVESGLAKAYVLSSREPFSTELATMPLIDVVETDFKTYFYITKEGLETLDRHPLPGGI